MFILNTPLPRQQHGISLIELIMFMVIVGIALTGIVMAMNTSTLHSADPLIEKQGLAIAESLLEEVIAMPFSYCDPDDASATTATTATVGGTGCNTTVEAMGAEAGETRGGVSSLDNVNDYAGLSLVGAGITDIAGNAISGVENYTAHVAVAAAALSGIPATDALQITVTVTRTGGYSVGITGYRTRFSPRTAP